MSAKILIGEEIWKTTKESINYQVSNKGRIRYNKKLKYKHVVRILKPSIDKRGYPRVYIYFEDGSRKNLLVHRLIMNAFAIKIPNKNYVNHIDGNKLNNDLCNLEWVNNLENIRHAYKNKLYDRRGNKAIGRILSEEDIGLIKYYFLKSDMKHKEIAELFGVSSFAISDIKTERTWSYV